jgi:hypothetical protein
LCVILYKYVHFCQMKLLAAAAAGAVYSVTAGG